jgi:hypothetical protein
MRNAFFTLYCLYFLYIKIQILREIICPAELMQKYMVTVFVLKGENVNYGIITEVINCLEISCQEGGARGFRFHFQKSGMGELHLRRSVNFQ